jgi:hypothetical protein
MRRLALVLAIFGVVALPTGAAATVTGGCTLIGFATSGGAIDLTSSAVWHLRSTDHISVSGIAPSLQTDAHASAFFLGLAIPLAGGTSHGDSSGGAENVDVSTLAILGRVFVIAGSSAGPASDCAGEFEIVIDDVNPVLTVLGGGGLVAALIGMLGSFWAVRRPNSGWRLFFGMVSLLMLIGGAGLILQQSWAPDAAATAPARSAFVQSVMSAAQVSVDLSVLVQSAGLTLLLVVLMPFPSELFNKTLEANLDEIRGMMRHLPLVGRLARPNGGEPSTGLPHALSIGGFVLVSALLYGLLDPGFGFTASSALTFVGVVAALVAVTWAANLPRRALQRTMTGDRGRLRAVPGLLLIPATCVLISRVAGFMPGYLYGLILGYVFVRQLDEEPDARSHAMGAWWMLGIAVVSWVMLGAARSPGIRETLPGAIGENVLAALLVAGIEGIVFGFVPLRFLPGEPIFRWRRSQWAILYGIGLFGFVWVVLNPANGLVATAQQGSLGTALGLFIGFGLVSVLFWGFFRLRLRR